MFKAYRMAALALVFGASLCPAQEQHAAHYAGPEACALCHRGIAENQARTAMANTWQGKFASWLSPSFAASVADGSLRYDVTSSGQALTYTAPLPNGSNLSLPVDIAMGGRRHGLGFLVRVQQIDQLPLARPPLVQARYAWSPESRKLLLAPGCAAGKPQDLESSLGLVLSPTFEARCLACHGEPNRRGSGAHGGVHCESCHGPGSEHLRSLGTHGKSAGIVNPKRLSVEDSMAVCAQCHVGLARFSDPSPNDLLIANQVRAIRSSECFLQSGKAFSCTACHDPHRDSPDNNGNERAVQTCLGCHAVTVTRHAAICPIDSKTNCIACHMPAADKGPLHLVDHLIRVHPEQQTATRHIGTQVTPLSEYLRMIAAKDLATAQAAQQRLQRDGSFYDIAREFSIDKTSAIGGYLGQVTVADLEPALSNAAQQLNYGDTSSILKSGPRWIILQRLPRDFRWNAEQLEGSAEALAAKGNANAAIAEAQAALKIYPHFLRALNFIAAVYADAGNSNKAADILRVAANIYPNDAGTQFALGSSIARTSNRNGAVDAYKKAIALEPDFVPAYIGLGMASYNSGDWASAIQTFRQGLQIDPLCAELNYALGLALEHTGDASAAAEAIALAGKLDPRFSSDPPGSEAQPGHSGAF